MTRGGVSGDGGRFERAPSLLHLVPYQWLLFRRGLLQGGAWRGGDAVVITLLALVRLPQFARSCLRLAARLREGPAPEDWPALDAILAIILASWLFLPIVTRVIDPRGPGLSPARLRRFPLSMPRLLGVSLTGALVQPVYWLLIAATAFSIVPLASGGHAAAGVAAGLLYALSCAALAWAIWISVAALIASGLRWMLLASGAAAIAGFFVIRKVIWLVRHAGEPEMTSFVERAAAWLPGSMAVRAAATGSLAWPALVFGAVAAGATAVSLLLLPAVLDRQVPSGGRARQTRSLRVWPMTAARGSARTTSGTGAAGGARAAAAMLVSKEILYLTKTSDFWIGLVVGLASAVYVVIVREPGVWLVFAGMLAVGLNQLPAALNSFGLDARAIDRYRIIPVSGREILVAKNRAFLALALAEMLPLLLAAAWKFGVGFTVAILLAAGASLFLTAAWGNIVSVRRPSPRPFFSLESTDQSGGFVGSIVTLLIWVLPLGLALFGQGAGLRVMIPANLAVAGAGWFVYRGLLPWSGRAFESRSLEMREMLAE